MCCKFQVLEFVHQSLELHPYLSGLLSLKADDVANMKIEKRKETIPMRQATRKKEEKSPKECHIEQTGKVEVKCASFWPYPLFTGAVYLPDGNIMLVDTNNSSCCLYDANFKHISHYVFQLSMCSLHDVSMVSDTEVVVSLNSSKQLHFLSVEQEIRPTGNITTHFQCSGIATLYKDRIVLSGINDESNYYWSIISKTGEELSYHDIGANIGAKNCHGGTTYLAVDESKTRIYMSCRYVHTLFCFNLDGQQIFIYKENGLSYPTGIGLDDEGNIYLVDSSPKLHKVSPDGTVLEVTKSKIPFDPQKICFSHNSDIFFITTSSIPKEDIYLYKLQLQSN